jgi:hypothetical protein
MFKDAGHLCRHGCTRRVQKAGGQCRTCAVKTRKPRTAKPHARRWPRQTAWAERMRALYGS